MSADLKLIDAESKFYFLKGRQRILSLRRKRKKWSQEKIKIAKKVAERLKLIPSIKLVGITGALAMNNSAKDDDIDFLIVSAKDRLWLTRILALLLIEVTGKRRRQGDMDVKDKICPNIFLEEEHLSLPGEERNLFIAHEVVQMKALWGRDDIYKKFLWENRWIKKFLPNFLDTKILRYKDIKKKSQKSPNIFFNFLERASYKFQLSYMKARITTEKVEPYRAFFHPKDLSGWVLEEYKKRLRQYHVGR